MSSNSNKSLFMYHFRWTNGNVEMFSAPGSIQDSMKACRLLRKNWIKLMQDWRQIQENYWLDMNSKWTSDLSA
jgi:hypothetical protein